MIPVSKATLATVKRFPELYKRQALQAIDAEVRDKTSIAIDTIIMAAQLVLVEQGREEEIPTFISSLQEIVDTSADHYEDAVAEGLRNRLHNLGIEYKR
jgi:hypothetical protein